jgi:predicted MFS family arabinose efflux permease
MIVGVPTVAGSALAGLLLAVFSAGELAGGVVYGGRAWPLRPPLRMAVCQAGIAGCLGVLALVSVGPVPTAPVLFLLGALTAPVAVIGSALLDDLVDPRRLARAYPTLVAAGLIGFAAGTWAAGTLTAADGAGTAFGMAAVVAAFSACWTVVCRRRLTATGRVA